MTNQEVKTTEIGKTYNQVIGAIQNIALNKIGRKLDNQELNEMLEFLFSPSSTLIEISNDPISFSLD